MEIGGAEFRKLAHLVTLTEIECYGQPSERALEQLRHKADRPRRWRDRCFGRTICWVHAPPAVTAGTATRVRALRPRRSTSGATPCAALRHDRPPV